MIQNQEQYELVKNRIEILENQISIFEEKDRYLDTVVSRNEYELYQEQLKGLKKQKEEYEAQNNLEKNIKPSD